MLSTLKAKIIAGIIAAAIVAVGVFAVVSISNNNDDEDNKTKNEVTSIVDDNKENNNNFANAQNTNNNTSTNTNSNTNNNTSTNTNSNNNVQEDLTIIEKTESCDVYCLSYDTFSCDDEGASEFLDDVARYTDRNSFDEFSVYTIGIFGENVAAIRANGYSINLVADTLGDQAMFLENNTFGNLVYLSNDDAYVNNGNCLLTRIFSYGSANISDIQVEIQLKKKQNDLTAGFDIVTKNFKENTAVGFEKVKDAFSAKNYDTDTPYYVDYVFRDSRVVEIDGKNWIIFSPSRKGKISEENSNDLVAEISLSMTQLEGMYGDEQVELLDVEVIAEQGECPYNYELVSTTIENKKPICFEFIVKDALKDKEIKYENTECNDYAVEFLGQINLTLRFHNSDGSYTDVKVDVF